MGWRHLSGLVVLVDQRIKVIDQSNYKRKNWIVLANAENSLLCISAKIL